MNRAEFDRLSEQVGIPILVVAVLAVVAVQALQLQRRRAPWPLRWFTFLAVSAALAIVGLRFAVLV